MSRSHADKDGIYITLQQSNTSETISSVIPSNISVNVNEIVSDLSQYDIYVKSMTISAGNIPYFNIYRNIVPLGTVDAPDLLNYQLCRTNFSISITNEVNQQTFNLPDSDNQLLIPINGGGDKCDGITSFLQYQSENAYGYPLAPNDGIVDPEFNCINFPRAYFDIHNIGNFVDMVNSALIGIWNQVITGSDPSVTTSDCPILTFDPTTQLYSFVITKAFFDGEYQIFTNGFLSRALDGFRWRYLQDSNVTLPDYVGLDNELIFPISPIFVGTSSTNPLLGILTIVADYSTVTNIIDLHSVVLLTTGGSDLSNIEGQYIPSTIPSSGSLPSTQSLVAFNLDISGLNTSANNAYIQYNALVLDNKLTCKTKTSLRNLGLTCAIQNVDQQLIPISIQANGGLFSVTLVLFKK